METRGQRNNNPLNIRRVKGFPWKGERAEISDRSFVEFVNLEFGIRAACKLLKNYRVLYGINTIKGIINRWAPETENNTADYILKVAGETGIERNRFLNTNRNYAKVIRAMARIESNMDISVAEILLIMNKYQVEPI